ncbi:TetR/AcrR family transcriptional regulator C-terminal domain-containing protein [soil metagenome]
MLGASLELADEAGLDAVTMQAVAKRLGVTPMALYRHVESKADLMDGVVERLLDEVDDLGGDAEWQDRLASMGQSIRAIARRHPAVFPLLLQLPASTPAAVGSRDRIYEALAEAGVSRQQVPRLERLISTMVLGFAASEASGRFRAHSRKVIDADYVALTEIIARTISDHIEP